VNLIAMLKAQLHSIVSKNLFPLSAIVVSKHLQPEHDLQSALRLALCHDTLGNAQREPEIRTDSHVTSSALDNFLPLSINLHVSFATMCLRHSCVSIYLDGLHEHASQKQHMQ
jgi:hypothetical protein